MSDDKIKLKVSKAENDNGDGEDKRGSKRDKPLPTINDVLNNRYNGVYYGEDGEILNFIYTDYTEDYPSDFSEDSTIDLGYTTKDLIDYLDEYVVGQREAKEYLAITMINHLYACLWNMSDKVKSGEEQPIRKQNLLIVGPSGTGKTYMISLLSKLLDLPFITVDSTALTAEGYVGKSVASIIPDLVDESENDLTAAEMGIVYIDEVDKIAFKPSGPEGGRDVAGLEVQYGLLKLVEGQTERVKLGNRSLPIDTHNMLFIFSGAFTELRKKKEEEKTARGIGFNTEHVDEYNLTIDDLTIDDLIDYGMAPEFMGRIGQIVLTHELSEEDLVSIILNVKGGLLDSYKKLFELRGLKWPYKDDRRLARKVAKQAVDSGLGARGLYSIMDKILHKHMLD